MSLDIYLESDGEVIPPKEHIYVREDGQTREVTREEWNKINPTKEPFIYYEESSSDPLWEGNITHNLNQMAGKAGIYEALWRPEELNIKYAKDVINYLEAGVEVLEADPNTFKKYNPSNGWGTYEGLLNFVKNYLTACKQNPNSRVRVSR